MKHLYRGLAASVAGLLLSIGLVTTASAAASDCVVAVNDVSVGEGDSGTADLTFTVTATPGIDNGCDGVEVTYTFTGGTATEGTDFTGTDGSLVFEAGAAGEEQTQTVIAEVIGDTAAEPDETFTIDLSTANPDATVETSGTGTITDDDNIGEGGTASINPTAGDPGTDIAVTATKCTEATGSAMLIQTQGESGGPVAEDNGNTVTDGTFTATLKVPADSPPEANYFVRATCGAGDAADNYPDVPFDVTGMTGSNGYRMVAADGGIFTFGDRNFHGSTGSMVLNKPIVGGATDISDYDGYWIVASDGGVFTFNAEFHGSLGGQTLTSPAMEIEPTPTGKGYWIVQADGTITAFGDAVHVGDMKGKALNKPMIGMSVTPSGKGYWLVAEDGGIFNFGDAGFFGSTGSMRLNAPIIDLAPAVDNNGYYLLGRDGGVFTFGSADFKGSTGSMTLNAPVVAMLILPTGAGYWLAASDGGVFTFGAGAEFLGSMGGTKLNSPVLDLIN